MSWQWDGMCNKKNSIALLAAEAQYISTGMGCAQILWMQHAPKDYGLSIFKTPLYCDSTHSISISKNLLLHF